MEHVASSGMPLVRRPSTQPATRAWNSCSNTTSASKAFTSNRYFMENRQGFRALVRSSASEPLDRRLEPAIQLPDRERFVRFADELFAESEQYVVPGLWPPTNHLVVVRVCGG